MMNKIGLLLSLPMAFPTLIVHSVSANNNLATLPDSLSQQCYEATVQTISEYYSDEFYTQISEIYSEFGTSNYNEEFVISDMNEIDREILTNFTSLYNQYSSKEEQLFILYGYNLAKLCELQYEDESMQLPFDHSSDIDNYYDLMISSPSEDNYNNFREFVNSNKIFAFVDTLETISEKEIAAEISDSISNMTLALNACTKMIDTDYSTALVRYKEAMKYFSNAIDTLSFYPDIRSDFTDKSIEDIRTLISKSLSDMEEHNQEFSSDLDALISIVGTISSNADTLINSEDAEELLLIKYIPDTSEHQDLDVKPEGDISNALDNQLISYLNSFNYTYRDLELNPNKASNTLHTKYKLGTANFLGEENTIYLWISTAYNAYPTSIEIIGSARDKTIDELRVNLQKGLHEKAFERSDSHFCINIPGTDLDVEVYQFSLADPDITIRPHKDSTDEEDDSNSIDTDNTIQDNIESENNSDNNSEQTSSDTATSFSSSDSSKGYGIRYK